MKIISKNVKTAGIFFLLFIAMNIIGLDRSPVVWIDEVTLNDPAKELAFNGVLRSSVFTGEFEFDKAYFWQPPGQVFVAALVYKAFGFGIWQTRIPGIIFGGAVIFVIYFLSLRLFNDKRAAIFSAIILLLEPQFIQSARSGRMDTQCLFFSALSLLFYLRSENFQTKKYLNITLSGISIGLAGISHPLGVCWALAIGVLIILNNPIKQSVKYLLIFLSLAAAPALIWFLYALSCHSFEIFQTQFLIHGDEHITKGDLLTKLIDEFGRYLTVYKLVPLLLLFYFAAFIWQIFNRTLNRRTNTVASILFLVPFLFNAFFMTKEVGFYHLHPIMALSLSAGAMFNFFASNKAIKNKSAALLFVKIFGILLTLNIIAGGIGGRYLVLYSQWNERDYSQVESIVNKNIPKGSVVWGPPEIWYALEANGSSLRLSGESNCQTHDYFFIKTEETPVSKNADKIAELNRSLPPIFGKFHLSSADYTMQLWKCRNNVNVKN